MNEELLLLSAASFIKSQRGSQVLSNLKDKLTKDPQNKPVIASFITKGRIYDEQTNMPLQGVNIKFIDLLYPMKAVTVIKTRRVVVEEEENVEVQENGEEEVKKDTFRQRFNIPPKTEKEEYEVIKYKFDKDGVREVKTDSNGEFELNFGVSVLPSLPNTVLGQPKLAYEMEGYAPQIQTIVTGNGEVLSQLSPVGLLNIEVAAKIEAEKLKTLANQAIAKVEKIALSAIELSIVVIKNSVLKITSTIQNKLFPLAVGLLILFGITKLAQSNSEKCPNDALLKLAIKRRNSIVKQLNNVYKIIVINSALVALFLYIGNLFKQGKITIGNLPFPVAVPPGIGIPYAVISKLEDVKELFEKLSDTNKDLRKALIIALVFLIASLIIILIYLKKIDGLIEKCVGDSNRLRDGTGGDGTGGDGSDEGLQMTEINSELLALGTQSQSQGNPIVTNVNGFEISVVVDEDSKAGELYRRQAIAKNSTGITILKGESSFSAEDQILIDELSFYIVQNNLKAD